MVTIAAGAVAVGIVSICAIPFGCFISRRMKKKILIQPEAGNESEFENEESFVRFNRRSRPNIGLVLKPVEVGNEPEHEVEELSSRPNKQRVPRVEIRVLVSNGSTRSIDVDSQGYMTASRSPGSTSPQREAGRRLSLQHLAAGPAADGQIEAGSSSLPIAERMSESLNQGSQQSNTTRLEITISGRFSQSIAQFGEFKNEVQDSSTPKSRQTSTTASSKENREPNAQRSSFWRRASFNRNGPPKIFKSTRDIEVINIEVTPDDELRLRSGRKRRLTNDEEKFDSEEERKCGRKPQTKILANSSLQENGRPCDRGRWGLSNRFLETLRESTSFVTL